MLINQLGNRVLARETIAIAFNAFRKHPLDHDPISHRYVRGVKGA